MAAESGLDVDQLSGGLAGVLPQLIDRLTPAGAVPDVRRGRRARRAVAADAALSASCRARGTGSGAGRKLSAASRKTSSSAARCSRSRFRTRESRSSSTTIARCRADVRQVGERVIKRVEVHAEPRWQLERTRNRLQHLRPCRCTRPEQLQSGVESGARPRYAAPRARCRAAALTVCSGNLSQGSALAPVIRVSGGTRRSGRRCSSTRDSSPGRLRRRARRRYAAVPDRALPASGPCTQGSSRVVARGNSRSRLPNTVPSFLCGKGPPLWIRRNVSRASTGSCAAGISAKAPDAVSRAPSGGLQASSATAMPAQSAPRRRFAQHARSIPAAAANLPRAPSARSC